MGPQRFYEKLKLSNRWGPLEKNILLGKSKANLFCIKTIRTFQKYKTLSQVLTQHQILKAQGKTKAKVEVSKICKVG